MAFHTVVQLATMAVAWKGTQQRCSQTMYSERKSSDFANTTLAGTLEQCVASCVSSGPNCAVMAFGYEGECLLYKTGGNLTDTGFFSTHQEKAEVLFFPPGCESAEDCGKQLAHGTRSGADFLCPDS